MIEGKECVNAELINRLHGVLRPFLLRRLKSDVQKQLPKKFEHAIMCRLSRRQRQLYDDFMASSQTVSTLQSGSFLGLLNVLMQLRKVCNHPDLFASRPIISPLDVSPIVMRTASTAVRASECGPWAEVSSFLVSALCVAHQQGISSFAQHLAVLEACHNLTAGPHADPSVPFVPSSSFLFPFLNEQAQKTSEYRRSKSLHYAYLNRFRCQLPSPYPSRLQSHISIELPAAHVHLIASNPRRYFDYSNSLLSMVKLPTSRIDEGKEMLLSFTCIAPAARARPTHLECSHPSSSATNAQQQWRAKLLETVSEPSAPFRPMFVRSQLFFPDKRLVQFDCGKLQALDKLLRKCVVAFHVFCCPSTMTMRASFVQSLLLAEGYLV